MLIVINNAIFVRIGADQSIGGGRWNGPVDSRTWDFAYVPIPETKPSLEGHERFYSEYRSAIAKFKTTLPAHLQNERMHLDPDFDDLTYGDRGTKGRQLSSLMKSGDLIVFYAGLRDIRSSCIIYAIIGIFLGDYLRPAVDFKKVDACRNAHTRRQLASGSDDIVVVARAGVSGRLDRCIPIGEYRQGAYRVREELLTAWGGISAKRGYLQRSAVFPSLLHPQKFWNWWLEQERTLVRQNNLGQ